MNRLAVLILTLFVAAGAVFGGVALASGNDLGMDPAALEGTPFGSYVVPGYLLVIMVGGSNLVAAILLLINNDRASPFAFLAGTTLTVWITVQIALLGLIHPLQPIMFVLGLMTMAFAYRYWLELNGHEIA